MRTVLWASLRTHTRRYGAALLAVVVGVVFVVVTAALSSAVRDGLVSGLDAPYEDADAVLAHPSSADAAAVLAGAADHDATAWLTGWTMQPVSRDGVTLHDRVDVGQVSDAPVGQWQVLHDGRLPERPGEAAVDTDDAEAADVAIGDRLRVGQGDEAVEVEVVGLVDSPSSYAVTSVYLLWKDLQRFEDSLYVTGVAWAGPGGRAEAAVAIGGLVDAADGAEVLDTSEYVEDLARQANNGVDVVAIVLLIFAAIALLVAVLVINNTFAILFAQRARDIALLRCVGATRRQLRRSIRGEALAVGALATVVGLTVGIGVGHGLVAIVRSQWPSARLGEAQVGPGWLIGAAAVGVLVTLVAAWLPTRRVLRTSPLAALRPDDSTRPTTSAGRLRIGLGLAVVASGLAGLGVAIGTTSPPVLVVGGGLTFAGVVVLGPVVVPALIRAIGPFTHRLLGPAGRLAAGNAVRNPRRTAATAASLLVGVTLTTAVLTGMASSRAAIDAEMDQQYPVDLVVADAEPLPADTEQRIAALEGVAATTPVLGTVARVGRLGDLPLLAAPDDPATREVIRGDGLPSPAEGTIWLPADDLDDVGGPDGFAEGDRVPVSVGDTTLRLQVRVGEGWGGSALVSPDTLADLDPTPAAHGLLVRAEDGADEKQLAAQVEAIASPLEAEVANGLRPRAYVDLQLDVLTGGVVGLLAIAVVIALTGIANTLGLSVLERGREHALLRALGLTRRGLRTMLAAEAVLLSVVATLVGTTIGVFFAWAGVQALVEPVVAGADLVLPWAQLTAVVGVAGVAGLLAAVLPSRRAARVAPAAGLALE